MSPIGSLLFSILDKRSHLVKYLSGQIYRRYVFLHDASARFNEYVIESEVVSQKEKTPVSKHVTFPRLCGPSVKKLLAEYGIRFSDVPNSGPHGNLLKGDVLSYVQNRKLSPSTTKISSEPSAEIVKTKTHDDFSISSSMKTVAQQWIRSKTTIPHAYMNVDCNIDKVFEYKKRMKQDGFDVSLNDFLVKSAATALRKVPQMNVVNLGGQAKALGSVNIYVTVAKESGYVSSIVKNADSLTVQLISEEMNSSSAKEGEKESTSLRISNLGLFGVSEFSGVISPPEVAILAVGAVQCVFKEHTPVQKMKMTLSFNNELISEDVAGSFISYFKECLENPLSICLT